MPIVFCLDLYFADRETIVPDPEPTDRSQRPLRILMVSGEAPPMVGGVGDFTVRLLQALHLHRPDWSLRYLTRRRRWFDSPITKLGGIRTFRPVHGWTPKLNRRATRFAKLLRYDLLHIQEEAFSWFESDVAAELAELRPGVPVVVTLHELHHDRPSFENTRRLVLRADAVVANDRRTADRCEKYVGRKVDRILFSPGNIEPLADASKPAQVPGRVCTFGLINRLKRFDVLFESLRKLRDAKPELTWHIVGPFEPDRNAEHRAVQDQLAGADWIRFTGALDAERELPRELHQAQIMLLPFDDGASLRRTSLQAGWRFGLPVVTTRPPEVEPGFEEGANVIFADRDDSESWRQAVSRLLNSPEERERIGQGGFETSKSYTFEALARAYAEIYGKLTGR